MTQTVAGTAVRQLVEAGVRTAYTVPGESFLPLLDAWEAEHGVRLVSTRHESGAAFMAEAEAKLTGRPALALASRGPGAANLAIGVHTARQDQTPLIAILGQVESGARGRESFQEVDLAAMYAPLTGWAREARAAEEVPSLLAEAHRAATGPRPGPVALAVPADFWTAAYDEGMPLAPGGDQHAQTARSSGESADESADGLAEHLAGLLSSAHRPVAICGPGDRVGRETLRAACEAAGFGVYSAFRRQDCFDEDHPHFLGHLGLGVPAQVRQALDEADLVMVLGTRLDAITAQDHRYPLPHQHLVLVGTGLPRPRHPGLTTVLDADPHAVLAALVRRATGATEAGYQGPRSPGAPQSARAAARERWERHHAAAVRYARPTGEATRPGTVHPAEVVTALRRLVPDDVILTNDAGNFSAFFHRHWGFRATHRLLAPCNGAMGYAVPAAVAAKLHRPRNTVVALVGDGGVLMTGQEIETAVRHAAPIVVLAFQNGMYGTIAMHQATSHGRLAGVDIGRLDLATWARGLGAEGFVLDDPARVEAVLAEALRCGRPCVVDVRTDPDVIAPGRRLSGLLEPAGHPT
ncbi:thiamine pyrophosphate-dependent enzyme [Actinopolymorpha singaporensis]|uniref:Acetolactate synthase-1/2/3 large subunit n=1 Tax=Actinopolymorpha singaporensis TaxID=117157 RepID=A0A1H1Y0U9_9ACTN|nr:thiamine pyrophosphate-dependent enzyme [Actinopolymorpha singaporensis]SDT15098.1 acetolactate synthase-1/2/3 large subunit [Actinopolymorpha singaporensis]